MAHVRIFLPAVLAGSTGGQRVVDLDASNLEEAVRKLADRFGESFAGRVLDSTRMPRRFLNFYVNGRNARLMQQLETRLNEGDEVHILPIVSGG